MSDGFQPAQIGPVATAPVVVEPIVVEPAAPLPEPDQAKGASLLLEGMEHLSAVVAALADAVPAVHRLVPRLELLRGLLTEAALHLRPPPAA